MHPKLYKAELNHLIKYSRNKYSKLNFQFCIVHFRSKNSLPKVSKIWHAECGFTKNAMKTNIKDKSLGEEIFD